MTVKCQKSVNLLAQQTARLEEFMQGWFEVILAADQLLRWKKRWFPVASMGFSTSVFLLIYCLDPSVLSGVSCVVMLACLADYLVPLLITKVFSSRMWTTEQEQRYHEICVNLVKLQRRTLGWWRRLCVLKEEKPKMYFVCVISALAVLAWIGQQIHNLLLTYLMVSFLLLLPGFLQHKLSSCCISRVKQNLQRLLQKKDKYE